MFAPPKMVLDGVPGHRYREHAFGWRMVGNRVKTSTETAAKNPGLTLVWPLLRHSKNTGIIMASEKQSIEEKVKAIIVEQLGVKAEQVVPDAKFIEDLGADSLDTVELVMALEEEFGMEIPDEEAEKLQCVGDVIKYIEDSSRDAK